MELYFSPLACSLATRIALAETNTEATFIEVDPLTKRTMDGRNFFDINPLGLVPTLRTDDGELLTENIAILPYVADYTGAFESRTATERARLSEWLGFISTELHKVAFSSLFDRRAPEDVRSYAVAKADPRLKRVDDALRDREFLLDRFSVADAYLITVLNWAQATPIDLSRWPAVQAYLMRGLDRPSVKTSIAIELPLYLAERRRAKPQTRVQ